MKFISLITEEVKQSAKALFVFRKTMPLVGFLKNKLDQYQYEIFSSAILPKRLDQFKYIFIFDEKKAINKIETQSNEFLKVGKHQIFIILINQRKKMEKLADFLVTKNLDNVKIINTDEESINSEELAEKILWFMFSRSKERVLNLERLISKRMVRIKKKPTGPSLKISKKRIFLLFCLIFFFVETFFIFPLLGTGFFLYQATRAIENEKLQESKNYLGYALPLLSLTKKTYSFSRPIFSFFYLTLLPDEIISLEENSYSLLQTVFETMENGKKIIPLVLGDKESQGKMELLTRLAKFKSQTEELSKKISLISQKMNYNVKKIQQIKVKLIEVEETINQLKKLLIHLDELAGKNEEKNYLILFQNNMELRPGGGFIGSFGILTFADHKLKNLKIEDVYEADGQLKAHIEPPAAIKKYFNQPHWFLRDSNFSPDFQENLEKAEFFLEKEIGLTDFDGGIGITTTAINYLLEGFGDVYLPDYDETINKDNFYIKTQFYAEKNFFPGSIQKKTFLSSLIKTLLLRLEDASYKKLADALKRSLAEKQIVLHFKNENLNEDVNLFGWGGKMVVPKCAEQLQNCVADNFFPVDANLGVNKANFFLSRLINFKVKIKEDGEIEDLLSLTFKNDSPSEIFPGGTYKNYFQTFLPKDSLVKQVTKNGVLIEDYEERDENQFKIVAFYFEVPPKQTTEIKINYLLKEKIVKGRGVYQLVAQKQIGSTNNDLVLEFYFPKNVYVINKNFSSLAKEDNLIYNTNLSTDRIFFIELTKE